MSETGNKGPPAPPPATDRAAERGFAASATAAETTSGPLWKGPTTSTSAATAWSCATTSSSRSSGAPRRTARSSPPSPRPGRSRISSISTSSGQEHAQARALGGRPQPLQAPHAGRPGRPRTASRSTRAYVLLIGPTGCGKTLLGPHAGADAQRALRHRPTPPPSPRAGYVGEDVENLLLRLLQNADYDPGVGREGASSTSTRSTRSARPPRMSPSPATSAARACSRPC